MCISRIIDVAIPGNSLLVNKSVEKQSKYIDLKIEVSQMWKSKKVSVIPIVAGALGPIHTDLSSNLEKLNLPSILIPAFQKSVFYSTTSI